MSIISVVGAIGSGKSLTQLLIGLEYANRKQRQIITNFPLSLQAVYNYACLKKFEWVKNLCLRGGVSWLSSPNDLRALLLPDSVCLLDEAGIFLNSREFAKTPKELLSDLAQSRKFGCDLIYCSQFDEQVDRQMRMLTQYIHHCDSISFYDHKLRRPSLKYKRIYTFNSDTYNSWKGSRDRTNHWRTRFAYSIEYRGGFIDAADTALFKCFNSFERLDLRNAGRAPDRIVTPYRCSLRGNSEYPT
jgi:Zonular occludens toxin (Zot)